MKKSLGLIITTIALTVLCVTPVFATESKIEAESAMLEEKMAGFSNAISSLVQFDNNCGEADVLSMHLLVDIGTNDVVKSNLAEQENYIKYLQARVGNAIEDERVAKQNVGALTDLVKVNPSFQPQLDAANAAYAKAVQEHQLALNAVDAAKAYFDALNLSFKNASLAKAAKDPQAIIE